MKDVHNHKIQACLPVLVDSFIGFCLSNSRNLRRRTQPASSFQQPHSVVRPEDVDALLKKIRDLEEQAGTQRQVIGAIKAGLLWMDAKAAETRHLADYLKHQAVRYTTTATPESKMQQIYDCKCCI